MSIVNIFTKIILFGAYMVKLLYIRKKYRSGVIIYETIKCRVYKKDKRPS